MKTCSNCVEQLADDTIFCGECGAKVSQMPKEPQGQADSPHLE